MKIIKFKNSEIEYIQSKENKIITITNIKSSVNSELMSCLRRLELLGKRTGIKEVWFPDTSENDFQTSGREIIKKTGYKPCILGVHPETNEKLNGYKKLL